jgi:hypothetical protein
VAGRGLPRITGMADTQQETLDQRAQELAEAAPPLTPQERAALAVLLCR